MALALLALAAALLAGSAQAARATARSAQSYGASLAAESESRAALAEFVGGWSTAYDSLRIGGSSEAVIGPRYVGGVGLVAVTRFRLTRLSAPRYVVALQSSVGPEGREAARRRLALILDQIPASDTVPTHQKRAPIARWSLSDLF